MKRGVGVQGYGLMCSSFEEGSYSRLIDFRIAQHEFITRLASNKEGERRKHLLLGPYSRPIPRALCWS